MTAAATPATERPGPLAFLSLHARAHRLLFYLSLAAAAAGALLSLVPMLVLYELAERIVSENTAWDGILVLVVLNLGAVMCHLLLGAVANWLGHRLAFATQKDLRRALVSRISRLPISGLEGRAGALKKVVLGDTDRVEALLAHVVPDIVAGLTAFIAGVVILAVIDWRLLPAALALLPIAYVAQRWTYRSSALFASWSEAEAEAIQALLSYVRGIATLKAFNRLASSLQNVSGSIYRLRDLSNAITRQSRYPYSLFNATLGTNLIVVLPSALYLVNTGAIGVAEFVLAAALGARLTAPLAKVVFASTVLSRAGVALGRVQALLEEPVIADDGRSNLPCGNRICLQRVHFSYPGGPPVLVDIDLVIPEGKVTALVGPSGAGKSTLARLLPRLDEANSGRITLGGVDICDLSLADLRSRFGVVFQKPVLYPGSIRDNIALARPRAGSEEIARAAQRARVESLLRDDDAGRIGDLGACLSGGEKQRIAIARAILKDAPILILDEATASVDPYSEAQIQAAIMAASAGRTLVVIAHRLASIRDADQIVVLNAGRVEACGRHQQLLEESPTYATLWRAQQLSAGACAEKVPAS